jgi:hypothetical protein
MCPPGRLSSACLLAQGARLERHAKGFSRAAGNRRRGFTAWPAVPDPQRHGRLALLAGGRRCSIGRWWHSCNRNERQPRGFCAWKFRPAMPVCHRLGMESWLLIGKLTKSWPGHDVHRTGRCWLVHFGRVQVQVRARRHASPRVRKEMAVGEALWTVPGDAHQAACLTFSCTRLLDFLQVVL